MEMAQWRNVLVRRPWWHSPAFWIAIIVVLALSGTLTANFTVWDNPTVPSLSSFQREANQPFDIAQGKPAVQPVQPASAAATSVTPEVEVRWTSIGKTRNGNEVLALPIPKRDPNSMGDGVASIGRDPTDGKYLFTPDKGVHKYKLANIPPAHFTAGFGPASGRLEEDVGTHGAFLEGGGIILFMYAQVEPWVYEHWRADVPLHQLIKGPSP